MLAIHLTRDTLKYAQMVDFKGSPFIESLGKISIKDDLEITDTTNIEVIRKLAEQIEKIRNSAEFPDSATHIVIDSEWFPLLVHKVDTVLSHADTEKYLAWRLNEMLESAYPQYRLIHQPLAGGDERTRTYLSIGVPVSFDTWVNKILAPSELEVKNVITDIQAIGDLLVATKQIDREGGIQLILDNQDKKISCYLLRDQEYAGHFLASLNWDYKLTLDYVRGDLSFIKGVAAAVEKALRGKQDPDNTLTNLFYFSSSGDPSMLNRLQQYENSCMPLNLVDRFNFREPDYENIDEYAVVLGALSAEIMDDSGED